MKLTINTAGVKALIPSDPQVDLTPIMADLGHDRYVSLGWLVRPVQEQGSVIFQLRLNDTQWLTLGKHNGTRYYWKKDDTIEIELPSVYSKDGSEDEEDVKEEKYRICPDKERYTPYVRGERVSMDCADEVALSLRLIVNVSAVVNLIVTVLDEFKVVLPKKSPGKDWMEHADIKWGHLNPGQQRMLAGQVLRGAIRNNEDIMPRVVELVESLHEDIADLVEQDKVVVPKRPIPVKVKVNKKETK